MKVLITGGTGFVGSHTVAAVVAAGHRVRLFVRNPDRIGPALSPHGLSPGAIEHAVGDVNDASAVRRALNDCDAVIHAGSAYAYALPFWRSSSLLKTNVDGTATVLRAAHEMKKDPIVYVSSSWALVQPQPAVLTEETPPDHPPEAYPRSKVQAEVIARTMQADGVPIVITYPGGVWGPHDPHWGETTQLVKDVLTGKLRLVPDGAGPFSDVRDVGRLHAAVLEPGRGPRRYLVPSHSPRFVDLVRSVIDATGRDLTVTTVPDWAILSSILPMYWLQTVSPLRLPFSYAGAWYITRRNRFGESRAQKEFGIEPRPFEESVRDTVTWMASTGRLPSSLFGRRAPDRRA